MGKLIIIYYHEIVEKGKGYSYQKMEIDYFEQQMRYLHDQGYQSLYFSELNGKLPDKAIIVSFDDGFRTVYQNAYPIMKKYSIKGNIYLPTQYIDNNDHFMTWKMIKELSLDGFEMQAHTHNHIDIRTLTEEKMKDEINKSNELFNKYLGYTPKAFCMPFGVFNLQSINMLKNLGAYDYILASYYGHINEEHLKNKILPRIGISNDDCLKVFERKLEGKFNWKGSLQKVRLMIQNMKHQTITNYDY